MEKAMSGGNCYEAAAQKFLDHAHEFGSGKLPKGAVLVHGRPTLTVAPFQKYGHAWIEYPAVMPAGMEIHPVTMVWECSNGNDLHLPAMIYYRQGRIEESECHYYDLDQARTMLVEYQHWGPWEGVEAENL